MSEQGVPIARHAALSAVDELSVAESHALFESRSRELLGMSREEFLTALESGEFASYDKCGPVATLLMLLPFATCSES